MSHISKVGTEILDLQALNAACKRLGFEFVHGQQHYEWYGKWVGDVEMPAGLKVEDLGKCNHAIRVPGAKYEVGVVYTGAGKYELRWDYWHSGGLEDKLGGKKAGRLVQAYAVEKTRREAKRMGAVMHERTRADGSIEVEIAVGGTW